MLIKIIIKKLKDNFQISTQNSFVFNRTYFYNLKPGVGGAIYLIKVNNSLCIEFSSFIKLVSQNVKYKIDTNYGCPAFYHEGISFLCSGLYFDSCQGKSRTIGASFAPNTGDYKMQTNDTSMFNCIIDNLFYMHCYGNSIFPNYNTTKNTASYYGTIHAGYETFNASAIFCINENTTTSTLSLLSWVSGTSKYYYLLNNNNSGYLVIRNTTSFENSYFVGNKVNTIPQITHFTNCFFDAKINGASTINCTFIDELPLIQLIGIKYYFVECKESRCFCEFSFNSNFLLFSHPVL